MMLKFSLTVIFAVFVHSFYCDQCPDSEVQEDFKIDLLLGDWYVVEILHHSHSILDNSDTDKKDCLQFNITKDPKSSDVNVNITGRIGEGTHKVGSYQNSAVATLPDPNVPGRLSTVLNGKTFVTDILASNNKYAVIRMCRHHSITGEETDKAFILSRQPTLDQASMAEAEQILKTAGADTDKLKPINQLYCSIIN